ncbi:hypothetical protein [Cyanobium sp. L1E-Cus]|uniref:glycosyltransferase family 2 protein n=1 Tax=Cyanobium sp. L1E-Cus TaxID=2823714 RepID=UPI0020CDAB5F|nr:hypothetical protein [Cyanobium sp. L1E-Cus]MCP9823667.1 glycosyltransferase family 2 protein [Cyanobium sp. L1E-Cus]
MRIIFSLVLYRHSLAAIKPLLCSIRRISNSSSNHSFALSIYNASPHDSDDVGPAQIRSLVGGCDILYEHGRNIGFGAANNKNFYSSQSEDDFLFVVVNPDISFDPTSLLSLFDWAASRQDVSCVAPLVLNPGGVIQHSAKHDPTLVSLLIGRFSWLKSIQAFKRYDGWHRNLHYDYRTQCIESTYLSGCFMVIPSSCYLKVGGFCERYFLHLEDADITRRLSRHGVTMHNPVGAVEHRFARGSHHSLLQMIHLTRSLVVYSMLWGLKFF